jgi:aspartyl-tRNA(Asn)/glutamyl-tRNA(Gln) amidotransferase subunit A
MRTAATASLWRRDLETHNSVTHRVERFLERIERHKALNCFVEVFQDTALNKAREIDARREAGKPLGRLAGMVLAIKDNILYADHCCTASSKILQGFRAPYTATALQRLLDQDAVIIGRTSCDEFAMGSSNETAVYGPVKNPLDPSRVPGGSSGGSAAAVAAGLCDAALGSDTGGSIRQPAAFCGIWGLKPTYGAVSRYGLIAYGSSFDQIGPMTTTAADAAELMSVMAGPDPYDATTDQHYIFQKPSEEELTKIPTVGFFPELGELDTLAPEVRAVYQNLTEAAQKAGFSTKPLDFPMREYLVPMYYILSTAEASSNLARYDGVRYGYRARESESLEHMTTRTRTEGFGREVRRRILLGTFVLSSGYYDAYYAKAQKARKMLKDAVEDLFSRVDYLLLPTTPGLPFHFGERSDDPIRMYLEDQFTVLANLTGHPALSFPIPISGSFPTCGMQLIGAYGQEASMLAVAEKLQRLSMP